MPTIEELEKSLSDYRTLLGKAHFVIDRYQRYFDKRNVSSYYCDDLEVKRAHEKGWYPFIPKKSDGLLQTFYHLYKLIKKEHPEMGKWESPPTFFLDAGCGIGNIIILAISCGFCAHGIEGEKSNIAIAKRLLRCGGSGPFVPGVINVADVYHEDLLTSTRYDEYDVLYFYSPLQSRGLELAFEARLLDKMKVGAYVIPVYHQLYLANPPYDKWLKAISETPYMVYKKISEAELSKCPQIDNSVCNYGVKCKRTSKCRRKKWYKCPHYLSIAYEKVKEEMD